MIYLDNAATTCVDQRVVEAMLPYMTDNYGNPGSVYKLGEEAHDAVEFARRQVAKYINAKEEQIIFTSGGTEGNNLVILGLAEYLKSIGKTEIITSCVEHESVLQPMNELAIKYGFHVHYLPINEHGNTDISDVFECVSNETGLISLIYVNNELGSKNPVDIIGSFCRKQGILFHTDCVQAAGWTDTLDVHKIKCDFMTISSHKIHGPKGVGAIFAKTPSVLSPIIHGGQFQEYGKRGGTENVPGIVGFGEACSIAYDDISRIDERNSLASYMYMLLNHISGVHLNCLGSKILNLRFDGVDAETLIMLLDQRGVCVSAGSACQSKAVGPSHVLLALGLTEDEARSSIRISFSSKTTLEEIINASRIIAESVNKLRQLVC